MRTTVTLDADTEALLRAEASRTGLSFKVVLNESVRRGLARAGRTARRFRVEPLLSAPLPPELAGANFNRLAEDLADADREARSAE